MWGGAESSLVSTVTANETGTSSPAALGAVVQALDAGLEHVDATGGVQREVFHPERAEHAGGAVHRRRDVEELQVQEDLVAEVTEIGDHVGAGGAEQLEADLRHAEPGPHLHREPVGLDHVVGVEHQRQSTTDVLRNLACNVSHVRLR